MRKAFTAAALAAVAGMVLAGAARPSSAQTPDSVFAVAKFIGDISIAGPSCGQRDRVWATRLAYKFIAALNALPRRIAAQLPGGTTDSALDALNNAQAEALASSRANLNAYCTQAINPERLKHADPLDAGTMPFW